MLAEPVTANPKTSRLSKHFPMYTYFFFTLFMVFFSVSAIHKWPSFWAQGAISLSCIIPAIAVFVKVGPQLIKSEKWPTEIKFVLIIFLLGLINICFSENQLDSFKGMGLFLMSGILVFSISFFLFTTKRAQKGFNYLCCYCFLFLLVFGCFEFIQQLNAPGRRILLLSSNPIPAGSLLILMSIGPLVSVAQSKNRWEKVFWVSCLVAGIVLIFLIAQRGPILALIGMVFVGAMLCRNGIRILILAVLILTGIGYQYRDSSLLLYEEQLLNNETVLVRKEFYYIALDVMREKPLFGLGFNSPLSRFIPYDYKPRAYSQQDGSSFYGMTRGIEVFDNMLLSFIGEMGGLFSLAYIFFLACVLKGIGLVRSENANVREPTSLLIIVLAGFLLHSLTFDSLKYPHLNWVFHSLLGLLANSQVFGKTADD